MSTIGTRQDVLLPPFRVLLADDDEWVLSTIALEFEEDQRFLLKRARNAFDSVCFAQEFFPKVLIIDIFLGEHDGREVWEHLSSESEFLRTKAIAISGSIGKFEAQELLNKGFSAFAAKPFKTTTPYTETLRLLDLPTL